MNNDQLIKKALSLMGQRGRENQRKMYPDYSAEMRRRSKMRKNKAKKAKNKGVDNSIDL